MFDLFSYGNTKKQPVGTVFRRIQSRHKEIRYKSMWTAKQTISSPPYLTLLNWNNNPETI